MQCTRGRKKKRNVNTAHGDECVLSAMIESIRIISMMVMKKYDSKYVIQKKRVHVALMQPVADKEVKFNDGRKNLNNECIAEEVG